MLCHIYKVAHLTALLDQVNLYRSFLLGWFDHYPFLSVADPCRCTKYFALVYSQDIKDHPLVNKPFSFWLYGVYFNLYDP